MGTSTFTGPLNSGDILNTSGITLGSDVRNVGAAVLAQTATVTQATGLSTSIVIPAGSMIVAIELFVTDVWDGVSALTDIGISDNGAELVGALSAAAVGRQAATTGTDLTRTENWINVGDNDVRVWVNSDNVGGGTGVLVVRYLQAQGVA